MKNASKIAAAIVFLTGIAALSPAMAEDAKPVDAATNPNARLGEPVKPPPFEGASLGTAPQADSPAAQRVAMEAATKKANADISNDPKTLAAIVKAVRDDDINAANKLLMRWYSKQQLADAKITLENRSRGQPSGGQGVGKIRTGWGIELSCCPMRLHIWA